MSGGCVNLCRPLLGCLLVCLLACVVHRASAAPFVNLDFEQATVSPPGQELINASLAFPGWTARIGDIVQTLVNYDNEGSGGAVVSLWDQPAPFQNIPLFQGFYMPILVTGPTISGQIQTTSLSQEGDIPLNAHSLTLLAQNGSGPPAVWMNAIPLSFQRVGGGQGTHEAAIFAADVSMFAGEQVLLVVSSRASPFPRVSAFDKLTLSPDPVPEPGHSLVIVMALLEARHRHSRRSRLRLA